MRIEQMLQLTHPNRNWLQANNDDAVDGRTTDGDKVAQLLHFKSLSTMI